VSFHPDWRRHALAHAGDPYDLLVIGGGITGCGVLLDACQRGLRVLLLEKGDLASGTSSRSSKLIHGGLRYLKQMQFGVTRSACRERDRMMALNPDLVRPIRFLYPAFEGDTTPGWQVDLGLWMYDQLTERPEKHQRWVGSGGGAAARGLAPGLAVEDLDRALVYVDAVADDAALTFAVAATGAAYGGRIVTRAEVVEGLRDGAGRASGVVFRDLETGAAHRTHAHLVVNAAGVWVDRVREAFRLGDPRLRPSRGSHLIVPAERLPLEAAVTVPSPDDRRPVFFIPHPEGVLLGTTDLFHAGSLDDPRPTREEAAYLLRAVQAHFPERRIVEDDVVGAFAGVRPILSADVEDPSAASREAAVWEERGLLSVAGGKLTTWREMAEEVVDAALKLLPEERGRVASPCLTTGTPLAGLAPLDLPERLSTAHGVEPEVARAMARRLRAAAWWAPALARSASELLPVTDGTDLSLAEVRAHLRTGAVVRLEDLLLRRARLAMWRPDQAREVVGRLRAACQEELGWDHARWDRERDRFERAARAWSPEGIEAT
jgi:glycerol-3-phosphate dehydrogenase